jgi:hypothetical protein
MRKPDPGLNRLNGWLTVVPVLSTYPHRSGESVWIGVDNRALGTASRSCVRLGEPVSHCLAARNASARLALFLSISPERRYSAVAAGRN